jgi:hypothetical protein
VRCQQLLGSGALDRLTLQHLHGGLGEPDEDAVVDLQETQQLQCFALLRINLVDALYPHHESKLRVCGDEEAVGLLGFARQPYLLPLGIAVFLHILLRAGEDDLSLLLALVYPMSAQFLVHIVRQEDRDG